MIPHLHLLAVDPAPDPDRIPGTGQLGSPLDGREGGGLGPGVGIRAPQPVDVQVAAGPDGSIWISREARLDRYDGTTWVSFDNGVSGPGEPGPNPGLGGLGKHPGVPEGVVGDEELPGIHRLGAITRGKPIAR